MPNINLWMDFSKIFFHLNIAHGVVILASEPDAMLNVLKTIFVDISRTTRNKVKLFDF